MSRSVSARSAAVAGAVLVVLAGATACSADASEDSDPERRSFALRGDTLTVDSDDSSLDIVAVDDLPAGKIEVTRWFQGSVAVGKDPKVTWSMDDDRLKLRLECSGVVADCAARHRIEVPGGTALDIRTADGNVHATGFRRPLAIRSGDGNVRVSDSSSPLTLRSGDGRIRVTEATGRLDLHTGDGDIHAEGDSREVTTRSGDGSVRLRLGTVPDRVETRAGDGNVTVEVPRATYRVTTVTGDGRVNVSVPRADSSDHVVSAHTGDGKVTVRIAN
ncbi:DUF4097 family beta strand repeat-containing protein [Streptomyces sp. NPDC088789]|uniref:DUF4097 family beta strand repeat-containing protein n=1 Tax=Streptomyces sp. NPDC088789 TaxID=3365899 RepID=UPI00381AF248